MENIQKYRIHIIVGAVALAVGFIAGAVWKATDIRENAAMYGENQMSSTTDGTSTALSTQRPISLLVVDQKAGSKVVVESLSVNEPSWIVVTEDAAGKPGRILGAQQFVRGMTTGEVDLLRPTVSGGTYHAFIYNDNGDNEFDYKVDAPLTDAQGRTIESIFFTK